MVSINEFWEKMKMFGDQTNKEIYDLFCKRFSFEKCEKIGISADGRQYNDILYLLDHLFLFESKYGEKYCISNTYNTEEEIVEILIKYNLVGKAIILGNGFWNAKTIAILFSYETIKEIEKIISKREWKMQI